MSEHFIGLNTHSLGANLALHDFPCALERCCRAMQNQFGSQVSARESDAGDDRGEQTIIDNHIGHSRQSPRPKTVAAGRVLKVLVPAFDAVQTLKRDVSLL